MTARFWIGETGRRLRGDADAQRVALYLITCPSASWLGLYYLPLPTLCHEVGISSEGATKALRRLSEGEFAYYDAPSEHVWVIEMARHQLLFGQDALDPRDNRVKAARREYATMPENPYLVPFYERYGTGLRLIKREPLRSPSEAPPKEPVQELELELEPDMVLHGASAVASDAHKHPPRSPHRAALPKLPRQSKGNSLDRDGPWPGDLEEVRLALEQIEAPSELYNIAYWQSIDRWLGAEDSGVAYLHELRKYCAQQASIKPGSRGKHKDIKRAFRSWLNREENWRRQDAERQVQASTRPR